MPEITVHVCLNDGWQTFNGQASNEAIAECYRLPKHLPRESFWAKKLGINIPIGSVCIWIPYTEDQYEDIHMP